MLPAGPCGLTPHPYPCGVPTTDGCILDHLQLDNQATEDEHGFDASCLYVEHLTTTTNTLSVTFMKKKGVGDYKHVVRGAVKRVGECPYLPRTNLHNTSKRLQPI